MLKQKNKNMKPTKPINIHQLIFGWVFPSCNFCWVPRYSKSSKGEPGNLQDWWPLGERRPVTTRGGKKMVFLTICGAANGCWIPTAWINHRQKKTVATNFIQNHNMMHKSLRTLNKSKRDYYTKPVTFRRNLEKLSAKRLFGWLMNCLSQQ